MLDPLLVQAFAALAKAPAKAVVNHAAALSPLTYLPFHLLGHHLTARVLPHKKYTYPAHLLFSVTQYCVEHFSGELPSVAAIGPILVVATISMAPYSYHRAFKHTEGSKAFVWAAMLSFLPILFVFKGLELGFPKDTGEEQAIANLNREHSLWHLLLHVAVLGNQLMMSCGVPWSTKDAESETLLVPPSPAHTTLSAQRQGTAFVEEACSPQSAKKRAGFAGNWAKAKAA